MSLSPEQAILIGLIATVLTWLIQFAAAKFNLAISKVGITVVAFVVSVVMAFLFMAPKIVLSTDPMQAALDLIAQAGAVLGFATVIYNLLLEKLLTLVGLKGSQVMQRQIDKRRAMLAPGYGNPKRNE